MKSLHSVLFFLPDQLSETTVYNIVIGILCILLVFSLVALYRRLAHGSILEGMTTATSPLSNIQSQTTALQARYDKIKSTADDQKNRIDANAHTLMKTMNNPNQSSNITHVNINPDDPSKTQIPSIDMS